MEEKKSYRQKLIICADDYGLNSTANKNIRELAKTGKIDRVAFLAEGFISEKDLIEFKKYSIKIDLHLTLPEGLRRRHGFMRRSFFFLIKYACRNSSIKLITQEWERQIKSFKEKCKCLPDGLNSHEYVHFFPAYFKVVLELAQKYNIKYVRLGQKGIRRSWRPIPLILGWLHRKNAKLFALQNNLETSDYLVSLDWIKNISEFIAGLPESKTEIVCHPERKKELKLINKYF